jgi:hypothetical protein
MTVLKMSYTRGEFVVTGPDIEPVKFKTRSEARDWCVQHYPGSPIRDWRRSIRIQSPEARRRPQGDGG